MQKDNNDLIKEIQKYQKSMRTIEEGLLKEFSSIKNYLKKLDNKVSSILSKIEELDIIMEMGEIMEEEEADDIYNTEWNPYEDGIDNDIYNEENSDDDAENID